MESHLKVKVVSLTAEMSYIRWQEQKWKKRARRLRKVLKEVPSESVPKVIDSCEKNFWSLRYHRKGLKSDARHTLLAYGFMRGVPYSKMEHICYGVLKGYGSTEPHWDRIGQMVERFSKDEPSPQAIMQRFALWIEEAKAWYAGNEARIPALQKDRLDLKVQRANDPKYQMDRLAKRMEARYEGLRLAGLNNIVLRN